MLEHSVWTRVRAEAILIVPALQFLCCAVQVVIANSACSCYLAFSFYVPSLLYPQGSLECQKVNRERMRPKRRNKQERPNKEIVKSGTIGLSPLGGGEVDRLLQADLRKK